MPAPPQDAKKGKQYALLVGVTVIVAGASQPAIGSMVRARWAALAPDADRLRSAFALESIIDELIFSVGPLITAFLAFSLALPLPLIVAAVIGVVGGLALLVHQHAVGVARFVGLRREWPVADLDGERTARHLDHRRDGLGPGDVVGEVAGEPVGVDTQLIGVADEVAGPHVVDGLRLGCGHPLRHDHSWNPFAQSPAYRPHPPRRRRRRDTSRR